MSATAAEARDHETEHQFSLFHQQWGVRQIGPARYCLLICAVLAQVMTVFITWQLWQVRTDPPNQPIFAVPEFSFGLLIVISLIFMLFDPCKGFLMHVILVAVASVFDQFRLQPQFLAIIFLMFAVLSARGLLICRWFLAALWLWAGIHKLLSPHWFAHASYWLLQAMNIDDVLVGQLHYAFALSFAIGEIAIGLLAIFWPRIAAYFCVGLHLSIFALLILIHWNYSVLPWNVASAIIGCWVLWQVRDTRTALRAHGQNLRFEWVGAAILMIVPAGFYWGLVDHGYANVLYSDYVPRSLITSDKQLREITSWDPVHVPFPYERRTHQQFFVAVAKPGDKLHLFDPRPVLNDQFFVFSEDGQAIEISRAEFFESSTDQVAGIGIDDRHAKFWLQRWGQIKQRWYRQENDNRDELISYAYTLRPEHYSARALQLLQRLPNLEELQLAGCPVTDEDSETCRQTRTIDRNRAQQHRSHRRRPGAPNHSSPPKYSRNRKHPNIPTRPLPRKRGQEPILETEGFAGAVETLTWSDCLGRPLSWEFEMPRPLRADEAGAIYHALNRGNAR